VKERVHQEAPVGKFAELVGLGKKRMISRNPANASQGGNEEMKENERTRHDCVVDVRGWDQTVHGNGTREKGMLDEFGVKKDHHRVLTALLFGGYGGQRLCSGRWHGLSTEHCRQNE
jgi:hypothetical protein